MQKKRKILFLNMPLKNVDPDITLEKQIRLDPDPQHGLQGGNIAFRSFHEKHLYHPAKVRKEQGFSALGVSKSFLWSHYRILLKRLV